MNEQDISLKSFGLFGQGDVTWFAEAGRSGVCTEDVRALLDLDRILQQRTSF